MHIQYVVTKSEYERLKSLEEKEYDSFAKLVDSSLLEEFYDMRYREAKAVADARAYQLHDLRKEVESLKKLIEKKLSWYEYIKYKLSTK